MLYVMLLAMLYQEFRPPTFEDALRTPAYAAVPPGTATLAGYCEAKLRPASLVTAVEEGVLRPV